MGVEVQLYSFLIRTLGRSEWPTSRFGRFPPTPTPRPGITPWYSLTRMLRGPQNRSGRLISETHAKFMQDPSGPVL